MKPREAAHRWADAWKQAWEALDAESIAALYREDALVSTAPFREPLKGRDGIRAYVARVFGEEEVPEVHMGLPIVDRDSASIAWWAALREEGVDVTLAGTSTSPRVSGPHPLAGARSTGSERGSSLASVRGPESEDS